MNIMAGTAVQGNGKPRIVATYDYRDEAGTVLYQAVRYEPKDFKQRRPDGRSGWIWRLGDVSRVLYRLPELLQADPSQLVFVVEGEKDADNLRAIGLVATTCAMGAGKWRPEYSQALRGRHVILIPDNDDAGRDHVRAVAACLNGVKSATILELPNLSPKGDVSDWLAAGGTKEKLLELAQYAARNDEPAPQEDLPEDRRGDAWKSPKPGTNGRANPRENPPRQELRPEVFTAAELQVMELPEPQWAIPQIVPQGLSLLAGKPKLGKSWLALNLALAVATGGVALGSVGVERGDVLYLALEDTKRRLKDRIAKLMTRQGLQDWPATLHLAQAWPRQDKGGLCALLEWLSEHPEARLIVIDTWPKFRPARARKGDAYEEDYAHAAEVKELADTRHLAILALAHCRKLGAVDPLDEVSGTLGSTGAADGVAVLRRERGRHDATLFLTGRDIDEREIALQWDPQYALWSILGDAEEYRVSKERKEVFELLKHAQEPLLCSEKSPTCAHTPNRAPCFGGF